MIRGYVSLENYGTMGKRFNFYIEKGLSKPITGKGYALLGERAIWFNYGRNKPEDADYPILSPDEACNLLREKIIDGYYSKIREVLQMPMKEL